MPVIASRKMIVMEKPQLSVVDPAAVFLSRKKESIDS